MIKAALLQNIQTRPDVFGTRFVTPLPPSRKPLPTLPAIVGDGVYETGSDPRLTEFIRKTYGNAYIAPGMESPGAQFFRHSFMRRRNMVDTPSKGLSEPSLNNPQRR